MSLPLSSCGAVSVRWETSPRKVKIMRLGINLPGPFWVSFRVSPSGRRCLAGGVMHRNARTASRCRDCQDITWDRGIAKQERRDRKHAAPEITLTIEPGPKSAEVMREWRS